MCKVVKLIGGHWAIHRIKPNYNERQIVVNHIFSSKEDAEKVCEIINADKEHEGEKNV